MPAPQPTFGRPSVWPGFIGNARFRQYMREAHFLVEHGALPHAVDAALTRFGHAMGHFAVHDMAGNDVGYPTRKAQMADRIGLGAAAARVQQLHQQLGAWWAPAPLLLQLAAQGRSFADWQREQAGLAHAG